MTHEETIKSNNAVIKAAYASGGNTWGHVGHVIERRPAYSKSNDDWAPCNLKGDHVLTTALLRDPYDPGYTYSVLICYFDNGKDAADAVAFLKGSAPEYTYRVKRYQLTQEAAEEIERNNTWKQREAQRFADGTYTPLPWAEEPWFKERHEKLEHFAHVSTEDKGKIAYTRDSSSGQRNIKVRVSVGRYLQEHFADVLERMPAKETENTNAHGRKISIDALQWYVKTFENQYGGGATVKFVNTREEMVHVYTHGPASCMAYDACEFASTPIHPVEVYAAGDLAVAYLQDDASGQITARALVWPEKLAVGRIYGDHMSLAHALQGLGYEKESANSLKGARLLKIPHGKGYVMPFIDGGGTYGKHDDDYFQIGGDTSATYTHGLDYDTSVCCDRCGDSTDADDLTTVIVSRNGSERPWCNSCVDYAAYYCEESGNMYSDSIANIATASGMTIACHNATFYFCCAVTDEYYHDDDCVGTYEETGLPVSAAGAEGLLVDDEGRYWEPANFPHVTEEASEQAA